MSVRPELRTYLRLGTKKCIVWVCVENHQAGQPVLVSNKAFIDFMFVRALEVATQRNIPMQIHTGYILSYTSVELLHEETAP